MNTLDKALLVHLAIQSIFAVIYLMWQFDKIQIDDKAIRLIIAVLNIIETVLLVISRFMGFGSWGIFALGAWYILNTILLVMQFCIANWGWKHKLQDVLWIVLYIHLFCLDVFQTNLITEFAAKYSPYIFAFGERINGTFWGDVLKATVLVLVKEVLNILVTVKSDK